MIRGRRVATLLALALAACQPAAEFPGDGSAGDGTLPLPAPGVAAPGDTPTATPAPAAPDSPAVPAAPIVEPPVPAVPDTTAVPVRPVPEPVEQAGDCRAPEPEPRPGRRRLAVFFTCDGETRAVFRIVDRTPAVLRTALEQLLRGPTPAERAAGYQSFFSERTAGMLNRVAVGADGVARIDFDDFSSIVPNASSSAGSEQLLAQLRATILQFPTVLAAEITFAGSCERFWNWLQYDCERLVR
jgi:hypothetical protein